MTFSSVTITILASLPLILFLSVYFIKKVWFKSYPGVPMTPPTFPWGHVHPSNICNFITPMLKQKAQVGSVFQLLILRNSHIVIQNTQDAEAILSRDDFEQSHTASDVFGYFLPKSLISLKGQEWREHRRIMATMLRPSQLRQIGTKVIVPAVTKLVHRWEREFANKETYFDAIPEVTNLALDIIIESCSGDACNTLDPKNDADMTKELRSAIDVIFGGFFEKFCVPAFLWPLYYMIKYVKYRKAMNYLDTWILEKVTLAKASKKGLSFIAQLANGDPEGRIRALEPHEIRDEICFVIFAGHETSAITMSSAVAILGQHPDVQAKVREEVFSVIGKTRDPDYDDVHRDNMPYLDCVFKEIQRMACVVPEIERSALRDVRLPSGIVIPKGADVMVAGYALAQDPEYWEEPDSFKPERWKNIQGERMEFIPFGAGHRQCIGMRMSTMEVKAMLASVIRKFTILTAPDNDFTLTTGSTFRIKEARIKLVKFQE